LLPEEHQSKSRGVVTPRIRTANMDEGQEKERDAPYSRRLSFVDATQASNQSSVGKSNPETHKANERVVNYRALAFSLPQDRYNKNAKSMIDPTYFEWQSISKVMFFLFLYFVSHTFSLELLSSFNAVDDTFRRRFGVFKEKVDVTIL